MATAPGRASCAAQAAGDERAHRLGDVVALVARRSLGSASSALAGRGVGDHGRGRRRRVGGPPPRPGHEARTPPIPISRPPAQSQATSGSITTPMATEPAGRLSIAWLPDVGAEAADGVEGQVDVAGEPRVDGRRADHLRAALPKLVVAGVNDGAVDLDQRLVATSATATSRCARPRTRSGARRR